MIPSAFLVAVVFLSYSYVVRCAVLSSCNATVECANNTTVCENDFCHIQAGQICSEETTTTVAPTVTTPAQTIITAGPTQPNATFKAQSSTSATSATAAPNTTSISKTDAVTTVPSPQSSGAKRRRRSTDHQKCVTNASCVSGKQKILVCACNEGYTPDNGKCNKDPGSGAGPLRVTEYFTVMVTTVLLFLL